MDVSGALLSAFRDRAAQLPAKAGTSVGIGVFQGIAERAEENKYLGSLTAEVERDGESP